MSEMKVGDVIAYECVDVRVAKAGEAYEHPIGDLVMSSGSGSSSPVPILRRIEPARILAPGESKCLPVERAHLDAHKRNGLLPHHLPNLESVTHTGDDLEAHYRAEHAREQAAKQPKWRARKSSLDNNEWFVERGGETILHTGRGLTGPEARLVADALNAQEAKP